MRHRLTRPRYINGTDEQKCLESLFWIPAKAADEDPVWIRSAVSLPAASPAFGAFPVSGLIKPSVAYGSEAANTGSTGGDSSQIAEGRSTPGGRNPTETDLPSVYINPDKWDTISCRHAADHRNFNPSCFYTRFVQQLGCVMSASSWPTVSIRRQILKIKTAYARWHIHLIYFPFLLLLLKKQNNKNPWGQVCIHSERTKTGRKK